MSRAGGFRPLRSRSAREAAGQHHGPNMTPMVDVVMVILVFFMVSAAFLGPEWLLQGVVPRPAASGEQSAPRPGQGPKPDASDPLATGMVRFVVELRKSPGEGVQATGAGVRNGTVDSVMDALGEKITGGADQVEVLIRPEPGVPWESVVRVTELAQRLGITRVGPEAARR
ncbi:MAG: ExbD/TolR family protein [bacterium]